jgi:outer membrane protein OmpA-like peptidoglycan-associated protein
MSGSFARAHRPWRINAFAVALLLSIVAAPTAALRAQGIIDRVKQKVKDKTDSKTDSLTDIAFDKANGAAMCAATNTTCIKRALGAGKHVEIVDAKGKPVSASDSAKAVNAAGGVPANMATAAPDASGSVGGGAAPSGTAFDGVFLNYDFVPGDTVIFAEDFARDKAGDFPRRLELKQGNFEVAEWQGQRFLRTNSGGTVSIPLPRALPQRFTFEADYNGGSGWSMTVNFADPGSADLTTANFSPADGGLDGAGVSSSSTLPDGSVQPIAHIAVMADGKYTKTYVNGVRVANVPNSTLGRGKVIVLGFSATEDIPAYLTNIRVAAGGKPLYDALMSDGRVATHGILFDTGSDRLRGESKPTLDMIGQMLQQHADLKLTIEGHTDNVGNANSNQTLSDRRAAAVRQFLLANYQIDASRLTSKGFGATKPAVSNDTPEARQQNRRVELVRVN